MAGAEYVGDIVVFIPLVPLVEPSDGVGVCDEPSWVGIELEESIELFVVITDGCAEPEVVGFVGFDRCIAVFEAASDKEAL